MLKCWKSLLYEGNFIATESLKSSKAPGPDRFSPQFYKTFKQLLVPCLYKLFAKCTEMKTLPSSQKEARMILILKPDRDPLLPES